MEQPDQFLCGGMDISGTADKPETEGNTLELLIPGIVCADLEKTEHCFAHLRKQFMLAAEFEFHGYHLRRRPEIMEPILQYALAEAHVTAYLFDKQKLIRNIGPDVFDKPVYLVPALHLMVIKQMLLRTPMHKVWVDEDIATGQRKAFNTNVRRHAKELWPQIPMAKEYPKHIPSHKQDMIQLADVVVYALQREAVGLLDARLRPVMRALWKRVGNEIRWGKGDDLRPYL